MKRFALFLSIILTVSCGGFHSANRACTDGIDTLLQSQTDSILLAYMNGHPDCNGAIVSIAESDCGKIRAHSSVIKNWRSGELIDTLDLSDNLAIMPGAIFHPATLAHMMEKHVVRLGQSIPTNYGWIDVDILPNSDVIRDYENETGKDSITVKEAFIREYNYLPYYLANEHLLNKEEYYDFSRDINSCFGYKGGDKNWIRQYGVDSTPTLMRLTIASGHSIWLSHQQLLRFYALISNHGMRESNRFLSQSTADSLAALLCKKGFSIPGQLGYGEDARIPVAGIGTIGEEHRMKEHSFAGFYPVDNPQYAIVVTLLGKTNAVQRVDVLKLVEQIARIEETL